MPKKNVVNVKFTVEKFPEIVRALKASKEVLQIIKRLRLIDCTKEIDELELALLDLKNKAEEPHENR